VPSGGDGHFRAGTNEDDLQRTTLGTNIPVDTTIDLPDSGGSAGLSEADPIKFAERGPRGFERENKCKISKSGAGQPLSRLLSF
jgi:hypothetical protein